MRLHTRTLRKKFKESWQLLKRFGRRTDSLDTILGTGECQPASPPVLHIFCALVTFLPLYYVSTDGFPTAQSSAGAVLGPFPYSCYDSNGWTFIGTNVTSGDFSYGAAKSIDLAWNWIVG
jgi:hypothetical protein